VAVFQTKKNLNRVALCHLGTGSVALFQKKKCVALFQKKKPQSRGTLPSWQRLRKGDPIFCSVLVRMLSICAQYLSLKRV
jgi:hypothetical protein